MTDKPHRVSVHWKELDILRGLAAVLMIVNHTGYKTLAPDQIDSSLAGSLLFISSFAPVLFFFVTGVGYGIQSKSRKTGHWHVVFNKVAILLLADMLIQWSEGRWLGLDFLGFIAISSLVLEVLRSLKSPLTYAVIGFISISLMRYLLGPYIHFLGYDQQIWGLSWVFGTSETPGVSYPLSPWMAYPFAGYIVGVAAMQYRNFIETYWLRVIYGLLALASLPTIAGLLLAYRQASFFRWGTVSVGFYIVSFAVILSGLVCSLALSRKPRLRVYQNALALPGVASLAVVPVHYFILELVVSIGGKGLNLFSFLLLATAVSVVSFLLAHFIEATNQNLRQAKQHSFIWLGLVTTFLLSAGVMLNLDSQNTFLIMLTRTIGQIALCLLFAVRLPASERKLSTTLK